MDAFETFYREHVRLVFAVAVARHTDTALAEDLTQETFFRAWRHFPRLAVLPPQAQQAWLVRTVRNLAIDHWRSARHGVLVELPPADRPLAERIALRVDVAHALDRLEEQDRQIVVLRYCLGISSREIGDLLQMAEGTVRFRLQKARRLLAERLAVWNPEREETTDG